MTITGLKYAEAGKKNKASDYNDNFGVLENYVENSIDDMKTWTNNTVDMPITTLATSGTINLADMSINRISTSGNVTFSLPTVTDNTKFHQILVQLSLSSAGHTITLGTSNYFYRIVPDFATAGKYDIIYEYDGSNWVVGVIKKGTV